ncbi:MAG: Gfo/Idh/MocA family oxidoreductase [Pseudomonadota bacterium]
MRLLIAGLGLIGKRHLRHALALPEIEVVGVVDPVAEQTDVAQFASLEEVDVAADAVVIATPSHLHAEHAEAAASRGWHMLIEKPVAHSLEAADQIIAAGAQADVQILVGHHRRHHAAVSALKAVLESGEIGAPVLASLIWAMKKPDAYFDQNWRSGADGSPVMINLVHEVDLLRYLFGDVLSVQGRGSAAQRGVAERVESGAAILGFQGGMTATLAFADTTPSPFGFEAGTGENPNIAKTGQDYLHITGTKGAVSFPSLTVWTGAADWSQEPVARRAQVRENTPLIDQLLHLRAICAGAKPLVDGSEGRKSLAVTLDIEDCVAPLGGGRGTSPAASARPPAAARFGSM